MDKSLKQEQENNNNEPQTSSHSTTSSSHTSPSPALDNPSPSLHDDDLITTSTDSSDAFETWTLVMDKNKNDTNRVEILANTKSDQDDEDEDEKDEDEEEVDVENVKVTDHQHMQDSLHEGDVTTDDLSDGISIISESESNGRLSPHPYVRDHLHDLNIKFATTQPHEDDTDLPYKIEDTVRQSPIIITTTEQQQQLRQRRASPTAVAAGQYQEEKDKAVEVASTRAVSQLSTIPPMVKRGLQGIFYIGVALAILALIGRMRNPEWNNPSPSSEELQQKVTDMELQNNLMRAEIDLLNKQVKYLSDLNGPQQYQKKSGKYKGQYEEQPVYEGKKFKAWSGNGDSLRPVEITKEDLKRPYKCPDGSFKEFAGMCVENKRNEPNIMEQFESVVEDFKQQSETMQAFEKVAQELHGLTENPFESVQQILTNNGETQEPDIKMRQHLDKQPNEFIKNKPIYQAPEETPQQQQFDYMKDKDRREENKDSQQGDQTTEGYDRRKDYGKDRYDKSRGFERKPYDKDYKKSYDKHEHKPSQYEKQSKENFDKFKYQNKDGKYKKQDDDDDDSKEYFNKRGDRDNSKERYEKRRGDKERYGSKERYDSKERYHKRSKDNRDNSKERFGKDKGPNGSGEWQEQYMKHRENLRKNNENKYSGENKNWFMKRGDSRENKRNGDMRYR